MGLPEIGFVAFLLISVLWDVKTRKIPNLLCVAGVSVSVILHGIEVGGIGLQLAALSVLVMIAVSLPLWLVKAIGAGDAKWFGAAAGFLGLNDAVYLLLYSILIGGVYSVFLCTASPAFRLQVRRIIFAGYFALCAPTLNHLRYLGAVGKGGKTFPFMTAVAPAAMCLYWFKGGAW